MDTQMSDAPHVQNPLDLKDLYAAFGAADSIVLKKYISKLSAAPCIELSDELKSIAIGENISLYQVSKIIYDKNENTQDKLTTVYSTIFSLQNYGLAMLLNGNKDHVDLYLGVVTRNLLMRQKSPEEVLNEDNMQQDGEVPSIDNESTINRKKSAEYRQGVKKRFHRQLPWYRAKDGQQCHRKGQGNRRQGRYH